MKHWIRNLYALVLVEKIPIKELVMGPWFERSNGTSKSIQQYIDELQDD